MLRFVTHKLKTQSLNEVDQPFEYKSDDDDRDSGTESDDENTEYEDSKEAMGNDEEGLDGEGRCISGMIHPSRPPNFDEETSTGSPDDLQYSSGHHCVGGGTFRALPTSMQLERSKEVVDHSVTERHSKGRRLRGRTDDGRFQASTTTVDDHTSAGEIVSESATASTSLSHMPSPVSSSMLDVDSALPSDSDHFEHQSSEEELDVINSKPTTQKQLHFRGKSKENTAVSLNLTSDDDDDEEEEESEKGRRVSGQQQLRQLSRRSSHRFANIVNQSKIKQNRSKSFGDGVTTTAINKRNGCHQQSLNLNGCSSTYHPEKRKWSQANRRSCGDSSAGSSDEEVRDLMYVCSPSSPPVEFCTSPPAELIRPTRSSHAKSAGGASLIPSSTTSSMNGGTSAISNNNNNGNLISTTTNFSAFSYISVSLPCSPSPFVNGDANASGVTRSPPAKLFQFSSSNFVPFEVCAVSPRKRHRQSATFCHHHHYPHYHQQQQPQFQPVSGVGGGASEPNGRDGNHRHQPTNFSNNSGSINHTSNNVIINQFINTPTNGCSSSSSNIRHNSSSTNAGQRNGGGVGSGHHSLRQRPCLDFEKMQQVRSRQMSHLRRRCRN